jgi:hypothetical protein
MFQVADNISQTAFYIAADDWTQKPGEEWKVTKGMEPSTMRQRLLPA